jgi:hypothetical protein
VRNLISRLASRREERRQTEDIGPPQGRHPLRPWQIRDRCFNVRRHGLDPVEIRAFLPRVADELATAQTALRGAGGERTDQERAARLAERPVGEPPLPMTGRWVIHLPVTAPDLLRARIFARTTARVLARLSACVDPGSHGVGRGRARRTPSGLLRPAAARRARCALPVDHRTLLAARSWLNRQ